MAGGGGLGAHDAAQAASASRAADADSPRWRLAVLVDADSCPRDVRRIVARAAAREPNLLVRFLANRAMSLTGDEADQALLEVVTGQSVDDELTARVVREPELRRECVTVVTRDIALAERILGVGGRAINDRGTEFDRETIAERRSMSDRARELRELGLAATPRRRTFGKAERKAFADALDRIITRSRNG